MKNDGSHEEAFYEDLELPERPYEFSKETNFFNPDFKLRITEKSKDLWSKGKKGQPYIILVDLENGDIHLYPSFNKNDGLLRRDIEGGSFNNLYAESRGALGKLGDLHDQVVSKLSLLEKSGSRQLMLGLGVWKSGCGVKFLNLEPSGDGLVPDEYLLIKDKTGWKVKYATNHHQIRPVVLENINIEEISGLSDYLEKIKEKSTNDLLAEDYDIVEKLILDYHKNTNKVTDQLGIKQLKNRSTSQNRQAIKFNTLYLNFFNRETGKHDVHLFNQERELPIEVFQKISTALCNDLNIPPIVDVLNTHIIPSVIIGHLQNEMKWRNIVQNTKDGLQTLKNNQIDMTDEFIDKMLMQAIEKIPLIVYALVELKKNQALTEDNKNFILKHCHSQIFLKALNFLIIINKHELSKNEYEMYISQAELELAKLEPLSLDNILLNIENEAFKKRVVKLIEAHSGNIKKINEQDMNGCTLLMLAADKGLETMVKILLDNGADVNIKDNNGLLASNHAKAYGHSDISKILLQQESMAKRKFNRPSK